MRYKLLSKQPSLIYIDKSSRLDWVSCDVISLVLNKDTHLKEHILMMFRAGAHLAHHPLNKSKILFLDLDMMEVIYYKLVRK